MNTTDVYTPYSHANKTNTDLPLYIGYAFNMLFGISTNSYVIWLIVVKAGGGVVAEFFTLNLCVCEIIQNLRVVFVVPYDIIPDFPRKPSIFFSEFLYIGRPLFQNMICVERYLAVVHPVIFLKCKPLRYRVACSSLAWTVVLCFCIRSMFISPSAFISVILYLVQYLFHVSVIFFCCSVVLKVLMQPRPREGVQERERKGMNSMKKQAFWIIFVYLVSSLMNLLTILISVIVHNVVPPNVFKVSWSSIFAISQVCGLTHPLLYLYKVGKLSFAKCL